MEAVHLALGLTLLGTVHHPQGSSQTTQPLSWGSGLLHLWRFCKRHCERETPRNREGTSSCRKRCYGPTIQEDQTHGDRGVQSSADIHPTDLAVGQGTIIKSKHSQVARKLPPPQPRPSDPRDGHCAVTHHGFAAAFYVHVLGGCVVREWVQRKICIQ